MSSPLAAGWPGNVQHTTVKPALHDSVLCHLSQPRSGPPPLAPPMALITTEA